MHLVDDALNTGETRRPGDSVSRTWHFKELKLTEVRRNDK